MINKETAYNKISELVQRFEEQIVSYKKADYNETQTRRDFIDPFFKALGWDMDNMNTITKITGGSTSPEWRVNMLLNLQRKYKQHPKSPSTMM